MGIIGDDIMCTDDYIKKYPKHYEKIKRYIDEDNEVRAFLNEQGTKQQKLDYNLNQARYIEAAQTIERYIIWPYIESLNKQIKSKREKNLLSEGLWCMAGVTTWLIGVAANSDPLKIASLVFNSVSMLKYAKSKLKPAGERLVRRGEKILQEWTLCKHLPNFVQDFAVLNDIDLFDSPFENDSEICVNYTGFLTDIKLPSECAGEIEEEQGE